MSGSILVELCDRAWWRSGRGRHTIYALRVEEGEEPRNTESELLASPLVLRVPLLGGWRVILRGEVIARCAEREDAMTHGLEMLAKGVS